MMRTFAKSIFCTSCICMTAAQPSFPGLHIDFKKLLPPDWVAVDVNTESKPYGWDQTRGNGNGLSVTLMGPKTVHGAKGETTKELLTIYIMPKEFTSIAVSSPGAPMTSSTLIGHTKQGTKVYVKVWTDIQTWLEWKYDISRYLEILPPHA